MMSEQEIIEGCIRHERKAQRILYDKYSRLLLGICLRYAKNKEDAEDILQDSFLKIFKNIKNFSGIGAFGGWLKRITVNTAITHYHKHLKFRYHIEIEDYLYIETKTCGFEEDFYTSEEIHLALNELPSGYKMVFNLYAIDGYVHKEIAKMLKISVNTSKSQYSRAKGVLRKKLNTFAENKISA